MSSANDPDILNIWLKFEKKKKKMFSRKGGMEQTRNHHMEYAKEHNYIKTERKITVPFLCTLCNDVLYLQKVSWSNL